MWFRRRQDPIGVVAINMTAPKGPWGGAGQFVNQFDEYLSRRGYRVTYRLDDTVDVAVVIDPRTEAANRTFGTDDLRRLKKDRPSLKVMHRVNECDQRKNTAFMDDALADISAVVDHTVFISDWLRDYHAERWFDTSRPHQVIYNGADPCIYYPGRPRSVEQSFVLVTHHWSNSPMKGFALYAEVDRLIAEGELPGVELRIIGRWPEEIEWRAARTFGALSGAPLAAALRECDAYLTASLWEPGGMHHVEGAQCGLPVAYHEDGGGIVDMCRRYGIGFRDDPASAIRALRSGYHDYRQAIFRHMPSGHRMVQDFADAVQSLMFSD